MKVIYSPIHKLHRPEYEIFNGNKETHADNYNRIEKIKSALGRLQNISFLNPRSFSLSTVEKVHSADYIKFIIETGRKVNKTIYPSVFPYVNFSSPKNSVAKLGVYSFDLYTPISSSTYASARNSAMVALTSALFVKNGETVSYALCRPPGHHAEKSRMGGYCYFNNAAIAAEFLSAYGRVAVLDVDFHHGNGTQNIFYKRADIMTISIHASPNEKFPYFSGFANEKGIAKGAGFNINFPLPLGATDREFQNVLIRALQKIKTFNPKFLIIPLGFDTHIQDPIGGFRLSTKYYFQMAKTIRLSNYPTVIIQEGGYNPQTIADNAVSFISGFLT